LDAFRFRKIDLMRVGLIGESPNDTLSIKNLLLQKFKEIEFFTLIKKLNGSFLDNQKTKHFLRKRYEIEKPEVIIFIRDLDTLKTDKKQLDLRKNYFADFNSVVDKKGIYLLNIWEIEALILADIKTFNKIYNTEIIDFEDVMLVKEPKEFLELKTKKEYKNSHNPEIFELLNFDNVMRCKYFEEFISDFKNIVESN